VDSKMGSSGFWLIYPNFVPPKKRGEKMKENLEERIHSYAFSGDHISRREFNQAVKKLWGEEAFKMAKEWWKKRFLALNAYGYVVPTKEGTRRIIQLRGLDNK